MLEELPNNIEAVKPEVDYFCCITNAGRELELDDGAEWGPFTSTFSQEVELVKACPERVNGTTPPPEKGALALRGIPRQNTHRRLASTEETRDCAASFLLRRRSWRKPFRVDVSTEENHRADDMNFYGKYSHIRKTLDYNYHSNYSAQRQRFQDSIITDFLHSAVVTHKDGQLCTTPTEPWLVFTGGAMVRQHSNANGDGISVC